jgi:hypothetical protein
LSIKFKIALLVALIVVGVMIFLVIDWDRDGLSTITEFRLGTNAFNPNSDNDGLKDGLEVNTYGTNPLNADTDDDGLNDGLEVNIYATNPLVADTDGDGLTDGAEVNALGTSPLKKDTDGDGLDDNLEVNTFATNPLVVDTDGDRLDDYQEVDVTRTNPLLTDTDNDGLDDYHEVKVYQTNPLVTDTDNDGLDDKSEIAANLNPLNPDTDGDGINDGSDKLPRQINAKVTREESNVFVIEDTGGDIIIRSADKVDAIDFHKLAKNFYSVVGDEYDFLTVYTTEDWYEGAPSFYLQVQNDAKGIGLPIFDDTSEYGSDGNLKGIDVLKSIDMCYLSDWGWANAILHETGHQWACYVGQDFTGENENVLEIRQQGIHYYIGLQSPYLVGCALGAKHWVEEGDHYKIELNNYSSEYHGMYHPFTLYFMGVMSENEVGEYPLFNANTGTLYKMVSVEDIIASEGLREPTPPNAQKDFKMAFILLTGKDSEPTQEELDKICGIADQMPIVWNEATLGRSNLN